jgi:CRP-like cAMP-binding protein
MAIEIELLKTINYFSDLDIAELEEIKSYFSEQSVPKGQQFISQGGRTDCLYFLITGLVKVYRTAPNGKEQILHITLPGDSLNDVSTFSGGINQANMLAMTPVMLYAMRREDVAQVLKEHTGIYNNIIKAFAARIRHDAKMVEELSSNQVMGRLAKLLMGKYAGEESTAGLSLTQKEIADLIGTCREVVNRSLRILADKGAIRLGRCRIKVLKREILAEIAQISSNMNPG